MNPTTTITSGHDDNYIPHNFKVDNYEEVIQCDKNDPTELTNHKEIRIVVSL